MQIVDVDKAAMIENESSGRELDAEASGGTQESAAVVFSCRMHSAPVIALSVSERARRVASLAQDGTVAVLELLHRPSVTKTWKFQVSCVTSVGFKWSCCFTLWAAETCLVMPSFAPMLLPPCTNTAPSGSTGPGSHRSVGVGS